VPPVIIDDGLGLFSTPALTLNVPGDVFTTGDVFPSKSIEDNFLRRVPGDLESAVRNVSGDLASESAEGLGRRFVVVVRRLAVDILTRTDPPVEVEVTDSARGGRVVCLVPATAVVLTDDLTAVLDVDLAAFFTNGVNMVCPGPNRLKTYQGGGDNESKSSNSPACWVYYNSLCGFVDAS
jgi:hypothetical protein